MTRIKINNAYFKTKKGFGRTKVKRAIYNIFSDEEGGIIYLNEQIPKINLIKDKNGGWKVFINDIDFSISYTDVDGTELKSTDGLRKFIEESETVLTLKKDKGTVSRFLKIIEEKGEIFIEFNIGN